MQNCFNHAFRKTGFFDGVIVANLLKNKPEAKSLERDDVIVYYRDKNYAVHASVFLDNENVSTKWGELEVRICTHQEDQKKYPHTFQRFFQRNLIDALA